MLLVWGLADGDINFSITGGAGGDTITAGGGVDTISGGAGADSITGGSGTDSLVGGAGADTIAGGTGADTITGGTGDDSITGGAGADTFVLAGTAAGGRDSITFIESDTDLLSLAANSANIGGTASVAYVSGTTRGNIADGVGFQIFTDAITVADATSGPTEAEMETYFGTHDVFYGGTTGDSVYVLVDDATDSYLPSY